MTDGVLPALLVLPVEREQVHDPLVDLIERQHLAAGLLDRHSDQGDVRVRRLGVRVATPVGLGLPWSDGAGLPVHLAHHRHVPVRRRAHGAHAGRQRGGPGALCHSGGHRRAAHPDRVAHVMRVHVAGACHARRAYVGAHGVHVGRWGVTLRHRESQLTLINARGHTHTFSEFNP